MLAALLAIYSALLARLAALAVALVFGDIGQTLNNAVNYFVKFVGPALGIMFLYGGYLWMFNHDDVQRVNRGKQIMIAATVGGMFVVLAASLANVFAPPGGGGIYQ